jgi:hypothetical protein
VSQRDGMTIQQLRSGRRRSLFVGQNLAEK